MKIEKIHLNKIKVTFSPKDIIEHNITPEAVRDNSPWVQKVLMNIVHRAQDEVGFPAENARLMVEAMPGEGDSMVMYITRLESDEDIKDAIKDVKRKIRLKLRQERSPVPETLCITFDDFEDAVRLARFAGELPGGELYLFEEKYRLIIPAYISNRFSEFGDSTTDEAVCDMIREHGKKICSDALRLLRESF